jgi:hypothetical protein
MVEPFAIAEVAVAAIVAIDEPQLATAVISAISAVIFAPVVAAIIAGKASVLGAIALVRLLDATFGLFPAALAPVDHGKTLFTTPFGLGTAVRFRGMGLAAAFDFGGMILVISVAFMAAAFGRGGRCKRKRGDTGGQQ